MILSLWNSRKEVYLLILIMFISCLIFGPLVFYMDSFGSHLADQNSTSSNIDSVPTGEGQPQSNGTTSHWYNLYHFQLIACSILVGGCYYDNRWLRRFLPNERLRLCCRHNGDDIWPHPDSSTSGYHRRELHSLLRVQPETAGEARRPTQSRMTSALENIQSFVPSLVINKTLLISWPLLLIRGPVLGAATAS